MDKFFNKYFNLNLKDYFDIGFDFFINQLLLFVFLALIGACIVTNYIESGIGLTLKRLLRMEIHSGQNAKSLKDLGLYDNRAVRFSLVKRGGIVARLIHVAGERRPTYEEYVAYQKRLKDEKKAKRKTWLAGIFGKKKDAITTADTDLAQVEDATSEATASPTEESAPSGEVIAYDGEKTNLDTARFYIPEDMREDAQKYLERRSPTLTKTILSCVLIFGFYIALALLMPTVIDLVLALT